MNEPEQAGCLGLCDIDWEQGLCLSCGRSTDEIYGSEEVSEAEAGRGDAAQ
jgi:predicted Fe-S protein YdhL (DUF1289 family)